MSKKIMTGEEFRKLREAIGDQRKIAETMEVHPVTVSNWESGKYAIPGPARVLIRKLHSEASVRNARIEQLEQQKREILDGRA